MYLIICLNLWLWSMVVSLVQTTPQPKVPLYAGNTFLTTTPDTQPTEQLKQGAGELVDSMNRLPAYTGVIYYKGEVLNEIRWTDHAGIISDGIFSFPKNSSKNYELYTPWKEGYSFYPEVVKFDENNRHQEFSAIKLTLEDELIYQFNFDKGVRNEVDKTLSEHELFYVNFRNEKGRGKVLCFDKEGAAIQFKRSPEFNTSKPFTISAWVNPDSISEIHTLVSKGLVFSLKIRYGGLSFAGTGFSSVIADSILVKQNDWQHISCVYVPGYHVQFFLNGQLVHDQAFDSLKVNEQALTIGNNFSSEAFSGKMDDLMIWNRALSGEEIAMVYSQRNRLNSFSEGWLLLIVLPGLLFVYFLIRRKRLFPKVKSPQPENLKQSAANDKPSFNICLFGDLFIPGTGGENLARQLTPRLKQLFILLAIHPQGLSVSRLGNDLWPGVDEEKAKQSRNYAIQQLKKVLSGNPAIRLEYLSKNWILQFNNNIKVDVLILDEIGEQLQHQLSTPQLDTYLSIAEKGKFLPGIDSECFDSIKAKVAETIISLAIKWAGHVSPAIAIRLGTILLVQDSLSEEGLKISIRALTASGRNGEAKEVYQTFAKRYKNTYNEDFSATFQSFS